MTDRTNDQEDLKPWTLWLLYFLPLALLGVLVARVSGNGIEAIQNAIMVVSALTVAASVVTQANKETGRWRNLSFGYAWTGAVLALIAAIIALVVG